MNRRGFFKSLGLALGAAAVAPQVLIPRADDAFRWKPYTHMGEINPAWIDAPYEVWFWISEPDAYSKKIITPTLVDRRVIINEAPSSHIVKTFMRFDRAGVYINPAKL